MRSSNVLLACVLTIVGCNTEVDAESTEGAVGVASQAVSYNAITASLNAPPKPFWTPIDDAILSPVWSGNDDHGSVYTPLWRGANAGIEDWIAVPDDHDCRGIKGTVRVDWDKAANTVHFTLKGKNLPVAPNVYRTEGVNFWYNPFHIRPKDVLDSGYRFWSIFGTINGALTHFYYDADTLLLIGSEHDFPGGAPPNSITLDLPTLPLVSSSIVFANPDGSLYHEWTISYDHLTQEGGKVGAAVATYLPHDLCQSNGVDVTAGQLRGYAYGWLPAGTGPSWADVLHSGVIFDTTLENGADAVAYPDNDPPFVFSGISLISNMPAVQGGTPNGYHFHLDTVFRNVAPTSFAIEGGNGLGCQPFLATPHVSGPNYCANP